MIPIATYELAQTRIDERRSEADRYRVVQQFGPTVSGVSRTRRAVGSWLVSAGEMLEPSPATQARPVSTC